MFDIDAGARVWVGGHERTIRALIEPMLAGAQRPPSGVIDAAFVTPQTADELAYFAGKLRDRLAPGGALWAVVRRLPTRSADDGAGDAHVAANAQDPQWANAVHALGLKVVLTRWVTNDVIALRFERDPRSRQC